MEARNRGLGVVLTTARQSGALPKAIPARAGVYAANRIPAAVGWSRRKAGAYPVDGERIDFSQTNYITWQHTPQQAASPERDAFR